MDPREAETREFLGWLETKSAAPAMRFSGFGGQSFGAIGANAMYPLLQVRVPGAKYDYQLEAGDIWRNTVAAIALGWVKKNFPEPRICVNQRRGATRKEVNDHEAVAILENPNTFYDTDALFGATCVSWFVDGNAYWRKGSTVDGRTKQFHYTPHWQMYPRWPSDGSKFISHYEYIVDGYRQDLDPSQVVHFRNGLDPRNYRYGFSDLACAVREVCTDNEAANFCAAILRNMGIPGYVISPEGEDDTIEEPQRKEMKELWRREFTGEGRGGLMVNSVRLKLDKVQMTPEDLVLDKIRMIPEARICAAIGLRPSTLGLSVGDTQKSYKNSIEDRRAGYEDCLIPTQKSFAKQITRQCPELFKPGESLAWNYDDVQALQEDKTNRTKRAVVGYQGGLLTKNEARQEIGHKPTAEGGDEFFTAGVGPDGKPMRGSIPELGGNKLDEDE